MSLDKYDRIPWRGVTLNRNTAAALEVWEDKVGKPLRIMQGSFRPYTSYSGSSHVGGGAADVWFDGVSPEYATRKGRDVGFAVWWRKPYQGPWTDHQHAILLGDATASGSAKWQMQQYRLGFNGLRFGARDSQTYKPKPIREFDYKEWEDDVPLTKDEISRIAKAVAEEVWTYNILNPLTEDKPNDKIQTSFALNRTLSIVQDIKQAK